MHSLSEYYFERLKCYINQYYYIEKSYIKRNDKMAQIVYTNIKLHCSTEELLEETLESATLAVPLNQCLFLIESGPQ